MPGKIYGFEDEYIDEFWVSYIREEGKEYTTTPSPIATMPDTGGVELTNGIFGVTPNKFNGNCSGYDDDVTTVIDMGSDGARLYKFEVRYMVLHEDEFGEISSATIYISDDEENWTSLGSVDVPSVVDNSFQEAVLELDNVVCGRYVKFEIVKSASYDYVAFDELSVYASMPVPEVIWVSYINEEGKEYTTTPSPIATMPDTGGVELTNGIFGVTPNKFNGNCSGYDDDVTTVIDMGDNGARLYKFEVRYMVLHEDEFGEISSATIYISDDEENWTSLGSVDVPSVVDNSFQEAVLELDNVVYGRYVKFEIVKSASYDYVAFDELSVYALMPDIVVSNNWNLLPDGSEFDFWDCDTTFGTTYYVDTDHVNASDENAGTDENWPFKTINKGASVAGAGDKVLIKEGVYFETIRDITGGTDEENMVMFEGKDGDDVVITGAVEWDVSFEDSEGLREVAPEDEKDLFWWEAEYYDTTGANVYMGEIPVEVLEDGYNPFSTLNMAPIHFGCFEGSSPHMLELSNPLNVWNADPSLMKRGLLFCDGERMKQVVRPHELWQEVGTYWVDESGRFIHFRLPDNGGTEGHTLELAVKEQGFAPDESGQAYIYLKNLTFEKFSNPFPPPQKGVISTNCGHHWIIEDCTIEDVNSVGLDMGFLSHYHLHDGTRGYHIVRDSNFINCGIGGIAALPTRGDYLEGMLVENNYFSGNCWHDTEPLWECAAIKNHYTEDCLYRNNVIMDTSYGVGIWLDKAIKNTRVCNNIIVNVEHSAFGGIQIEATYDKNLVDHNFIYDTGHRQPPVGSPVGGYGIYLGEVDNIGIYGNIIFDLAGDGIFYPNVTDPRMIGTYVRKPTYGCGNVIMRNIIDDCDYLITHLTRYNFTDENVMDGYSPSIDPPWSDPFRIRKESTDGYSLAEIRQELGFEQNGAIITDEISLDDFDSVNLTAEITVNEDTEVLDLTDGDEIYNYMANLLELLE